MAGRLQGGSVYGPGTEGIRKYAFSHGHFNGGLNMEPMTPAVHDIFVRGCELAGTPVPRDQPVWAAMNIYPQNTRAGLGAHSDDDKIHPKGGAMMVVCFSWSIGGSPDGSPDGFATGGARKMVFKPKPTKFKDRPLPETIELEVQPGSMYIMHGAKFQENWTHEVAPRRKREKEEDGTRLSVTFRTIDPARYHLMPKGVRKLNWEDFQKKMSKKYEVERDEDRQMLELVERANRKEWETPMNDVEWV